MAAPHWFCAISPAAKKMPTFEVRMKPQGKTLAAYMRSRERVSFIMGPLGSGKTFQSCQKILTLMCEQAPSGEGKRKSRFYAVRNTYPDLMSTTIKDWLELFGDLGRFKAGGMEPPTHFLDFDLPDGTRVISEVVFLALDRPEHVKKLRGAQATGFWLNEIKELAKAVVDMADLRHGRYPSAMDGGPTWHGMFGDTNAPDDDHWYYRLAEEEQPAGWEFHRQPGGVMRAGENEHGRSIWVPNPEAENTNNLPPGYYESGLQGKSEAWIAINLGNEYGAIFTGRPVYPEWNDRLHVAPAPLKPFGGLPVLIGWDFGLTPACIISQVSRRGQWRVLDELVAEGMGIRQFIRDVVKPHLAMHYPGIEVVSTGDPAGMQRAQADSDARTCYDELKTAGIPTKPARTNGFTARRESVAGFLTRLVDGEAAFLLSPTCKTLRKGFNGGYHYRRVQVPGEERFTDDPNKNWASHPHDALQYIGLHIDTPKRAATPVRQSAYRPASSAGY